MVVFRGKIIFKNASLSKFMALTVCCAFLSLGYLVRRNRIKFRHQLNAILPSD